MYIVGAGPGDPGLLTVRALRLLESADVVLHDYLVSGDVLASCGPLTHVIDVGKIGHGHQTEQDDIERLLVTYARSGLSVVRLKGGDPLLFGRGAEEAYALRSAGVPFEIVPGVSSALAAPAAAGIPLTMRGEARSVAIVTGHCAGRGRLPEIPFADTTVVLMGMSQVAAIAESLIAAGHACDTPAAAVERGTWIDQRVVVATLGTLADAVATHRIQAPAVLVVGETVRHHAQLAGAVWCEAARELA